MAITAADFELPGGIESYEQYKKAQKAPKFIEERDVNDEMGQKEFLLLFTTQLQNQNPLDPMKNEEFVAQLAQFSQLEATTSMSESLNGLVGSLQKERMLTGASLIGKKVQAPGGPALLEAGRPISGVLELDKNAGAESVALSVYDETGKLIRHIDYGRRPPGDFTVSWDGKNNEGILMPDGNYGLVASVRGYDGSNVQLPISTPSRITAVTYSPEFDDLILEVANGATINLSQVKRIDGDVSVNPVVQSTGGPAILDLLKDRTEINTGNKSRSETEADQENQNLNE